MKNLFYILIFSSFTFQSFAQEVQVITDPVIISEINESGDLKALFVSCNDNQHESCGMILVPEKISIECNCEGSVLEIETITDKNPVIATAVNERLLKSAYTYTLQNNVSVRAINQMTLNATAYLQLHYKKGEEAASILFATAL